MGNKSDCRFAVEYEGKALRLFSITQRSNNDLVIKPKQAEFYREFGQDFLDTNPVIINQKYSVHCSPNSPTNINAVKHILELSNQKTVETRHYTKAIKQNNSFAPLYIARSPDLSNPRYEIDRTKKDVTILGKYNPKKSVLYYMIAVGKHDNVPAFSNEDDFNSRSVVFKEFSVTIVWSFGCTPSDHTGAKSHLLTIPPERLPTGLNHSGEGFNSNELIQIYKLNRQNLDREFKNLVIQKFPQFANDMPLIDALV